MSSNISKVFQRDLDEVFAYHTNICLVLKGGYIGTWFRILQFLIIVYFTFVVYFVEEGYYEKEMASGLTLLHTSGASIGTVNQDDESAWDAYDVSSAFVEGDSIFIATNMVQHFAQKIDTCSDIYRPCDRDEDCITFIGEMCKAGKCFGPNWCNTETSSNVFDFDITDRYYVWVRSQTNFDVITQGKNFSSLGAESSIIYPNDNANTYTIRQILDLAHVSYRDIREEGAILKVNVFWDCLIGSTTCNPTLNASRVDKFTEDDFLGATQTKFTYYVEGGVTYRNVYNMTGLRLIFDSRAKGRQLAVEDILLQIATMIATLRTAYYIYDFIINNFLKGYEKFKQKKYIMAPEYHEPQEPEEEFFKTLQERISRPDESHSERSDDETNKLIDPDDQYEERSHTRLRDIDSD